jgi:hypothetical protein
MTSDLFLRRKWTFRAYGKQVVFIKRSNERSSHVLMKAFLWALYLPRYPDLSVEVRVGDRYKPDVVALGDDGHPVFWAEAGQVGLEKIRSLLRRYRDTHFAIAKWDTRLDPYLDLVSDALSGLRRSAPVDLFCFPADSAQRFINERGDIQLTMNDLEWVRLGEPSRRQ